MKPRLIAAVLLPFAACTVQWLLWDYVQPYVWFLFFPTAYFSAWIGGLGGGLAGTVLSALLVWYVFMPPQFSFAIEGPAAGFSIVVFTLTGALFAFFFDRLQTAQRSNEALLKASVDQASTAQREAETALRATERSYQGLFENMMNGYAYCRMLFDDRGEAEDFIYLSVNRAFESQTGLRNVVGRRVSDVIPGVRQSDPGLFKIYGRVARGGPPERFETQVEALQMWFSVSVHSPRPEHVVAVFDVITERKQAELALQESERRYRELLENANSAIVEWSCDGRITLFNGFAQRLFGWAGDEALGKHVGLLVPERESTGADLTGLVRDIAAHPERHQTNVNENVRRDGRRVWMSWTNRAIRDKQGRVTGILAIGNNISEHKQAEDDLKRRNEELERFDRAAVGRELAMIELKGQVNDLSRQLGREPPFDLAFADDLPTQVGSPTK